MSTERTRKLAAAAGALLVAATAALIAQAPITRTVLQRGDSSRAGYEAVTAKAEFPSAGSTTGKHTHPGDEVSYVLEGTLTLDVDGAASRSLKAGDAFIVPAGKVHTAVAVGGKAVVIANYIVEKGKPLTSPAQ
jgi:quercetin dioxygenase-like cupin family protein